MTEAQSKLMGGDMTKATHTPGPWMPPEPTSNRVILEGGTIYKIRANKRDKTPIVFVAGLDDDGRDEGPANASLIAAAPDLLEALEVMTERQSLYSGGHDDGAITKARAAIAKAKGEAQ
jgi:hypothetical protein